VPVATVRHTPIHYLYRSVKPEQLAALYAVADACVISSVRDGLNLVSFEYAACQDQKKGVLLMSSYVGAAKILPPSSMVIMNPWDKPRFAEKIKEVLTMGEKEREERHAGVMKIVDNWTRFGLPSRSHKSCPLLPFEVVQFHSVELNVKLC
jgi:trehalose 6-phosphate synthase